MSYRSKWFVNRCKYANFNSKEIVSLAHEFFFDCMFEFQEMKEIYLLVNEKWPEEYDYMPLYMIKNNKDYIIEYDFDCNDPEKYKVYDFDAKYFEYLANKARSSKVYTKKLISYMKNINNLSLKYYSLQFIKIRNIDIEDLDVSYFIEDMVNEYKIDGKKIKSLRDLLSFLKKNTFIKNVTDVKKYIDVFLKEKLGIEIKGIVTQFIVFVEEILLSLDEKTANSLKVNFSILSKKWISDDNYDLNKASMKYILQYINDDFIHNDKVGLSEFYEKNKEVLNDVSSGYIPLFSVITKGVIEDE